MIKQFFFDFKDVHDIIHEDAEVLENLSITRKSNYQFLKDLLLKRMRKENGINKSFTAFGNFNEANNIGNTERITNL